MTTQDRRARSVPNDVFLLLTLKKLNRPTEKIAHMKTPKPIDKLVKT